MAARKLRSINAEDLYLFNTVTEVRISPDGQSVVYTVQRVDRKTEKKFTNLWMAPTNGGEAWQFTVGDQRDGSARWSVYHPLRGWGGQPLDSD
jgi:dipeptidyl aminopeptidase/acylaminoacyl peptidase